MSSPIARRAAYADLAAETLPLAGYVGRLNERSNTFRALTRSLSGDDARAQDERELAKAEIIAERCAAARLPPTGTAARLTRQMTDSRMNELYGRKIR